MKARTSKLKRHTLETRISVRLNLDGKGKSKIATGIPFFDHMLTLFAKHATVDLELRCDGDLAVDAHHTVEDCGIALGQAIAAALGDKRGIRRYGHGFHPQNPFTGLRSKATARQAGEAYVPMDECLARCVVDFSGRPFLVWRGLDQYSQKKISDAEKNQDVSSTFRFGLAREFFHPMHPVGRPQRNQFRTLRMNVTKSILCGITILGLIAGCKPPETKTSPSPPAASAINPITVILAAHTGGDRVDVEIRQRQEQIRAGQQPEAALERLGWLFVAKAREGFDPGYYKLAEQCALALEKQTGETQPSRPLM